MTGEAPQGSYREDAAVELCELLTVAAEESIQKLFEGTYNDEVNTSLPYEFRTGVLKRSVAFEKDPEYKKWVLEDMPASLLAEFKALLLSGANDEMKIGRLPQMTANDFYRACAIGYKACGYDGTDAPLVDQYFLHADGRDEGLSGRGDGLNRGTGIDLDDPDAWEHWYFNREIRGGHPFEVCRGGNSTHVDLFVSHDRKNIDWKVRTGRISQEEADRHERGFYFTVGGKHRAAEAVKFYMAITAAGLPVILSEADEILARFEATDYVGIVPHSVTPKYCESMFSSKYGHVINFWHVDKEEMELYGNDIEWIPEAPAKLRSTESMKGKKLTQYTKEQNMELCDKYPFLIPTNRKSGKRITDGAGYWPEKPEKVPNWDYERTELDNMPYGWRKAFGEQLCEELKEELVKAGALDNYRILQIKEKFGMLCWYDVGNTERGKEIIRKFEEQSARICINCGEPATRATTGWVRPTCDDCCPDMDASVPLDEWLAKKQKELDDCNQSGIRMSEMA